MATVLIVGRRALAFLEQLDAWQHETCPHPYPPAAAIGCVGHWHRGADRACTGCGSTPPTFTSERTP